MDDSQDLLWILDSDAESVSLYQQTLGLQYQVRSFDEMDPLVEALMAIAPEEPRLLIIDPANTKLTMSNFVGRTAANGSSLRLPEFLVCSRADDLELMRFYLKTGARDYIFKPLRHNELIAKVERVLHQI